MINMIKRVLTGTAFVAAIVGSIIFSPVSFVCLLLIIVVLCLLEFYTLAEKTGSKPHKIIGLASGLLLVFSESSVAPLSGISNSNLQTFLLPLLFFMFIIELYKKSPYPFVNIAYTLLGVFYIALPLLLLYRIAIPDLTTGSRPNIVLGYFILVWTYDTGAFLVGINFGKHRMFERISPKKSWEGFLGGAVLTMAAAWFLASCFTELQPADWLIIAVLTVVFGTFGDLAQSMLKRSAGVKDSGNILPGHGGALDRFDGMLLSVPFVYLYLQFI